MKFVSGDVKHESLQKSLGLANFHYAMDNSLTLVAFDRISGKKNSKC